MGCRRQWPRVVVLPPRVVVLPQCQQQGWPPASSPAASPPASAPPAAATAAASVSAFCTCSPAGPICKIVTPGSPALLQHGLEQGSTV